MSQYNLHPANSVVQQLTAQPVQLGDQVQSLPPIPGLPAYQPPAQAPQVSASPAQNTEAPSSASDFVRNYARIDIPEAQLGQIPDTPTEAPQSLTPLVPQTAPDQLTQYYQQQLKGYDNPWYKQHPVATRFLGMQQYGLPGLFLAPQIAQRMVDQNKARTLLALQQAQQTDATNKAHLGAYNSLAQLGGLPSADPNSVIDDKDLTMAQAIALKHGAPALMAAINKYNIDLQNYKSAQADLKLYNDRKNRGLLQPIGKDKAGNPIYPEAPVVPDIPELSTKDINPLLDAGTVAGVTGTSGEAANTGINTALEPSKDVTSEQQAQVEEDKLQHQLVHDNQEIELARQKANEDTRHNTVSEGIQQTQADTSAQNVGSQIDQRQKNLQIEGLKAQQGVEKNWLDTTDRFLKQRYGVDSKGNIKAPKPGSPDYEAYQVLQSGIARRQQKLRDLADQITQTAAGQPVHEQRPVIAASGQRLSQSTPSIKGSPLLKNLAKRYNIH